MPVVVILLAYPGLHVEALMAHINDCIPGTRVRINHSGVPRVNGRIGVIVEVSRIKRSPSTAVQDTVAVDVPGHGEVVVAPEDLELVT